MTHGLLSSISTQRLVDRYSILTFFLAGCSILYELVLAHTLSLLAANTVIWYSVVIGCFLLGMGLGAGFDSKFLGRFSSLTKLVWVELILSALGAIAVPILHFTHAYFLQRYVWEEALLELNLFFGIAIFLPILVGVLTGMELPILMDLSQKEHEDDNVSFILGWDYIGSLVGAFLFPFVVLPNLELPIAAIVIASVNVSIALLLLMLGSRWNRIVTIVPAVTGITLGMAFVMALGRPNKIEQYFLQQYYYYIEKSDSFSSLLELSSIYPRVERESSPYQKIDIFHDVMREPDEILIRAYSDKLASESDFPNDKMLFLNGDFQINSSFDEIYHEYFAHVPISMYGRAPKDVLVLGAGDGLLIHELLKYPEMRIRHIDLDTELVRLAKTHPILRRINRNSMNDPRVKTEFSDGYFFVRTASDTFDAIFIDFPAPVDYNLSKLYSREFFAFLKQRLKPGGFAVFDATGIGLLTMPTDEGKQQLTTDNSWPIYYHTLKAAGFEQIEPYLTTLELDNPRIIPELIKAGTDFSQAEELQTLLHSVSNKEDRKNLEEAFYHSISVELAKEFMVGLQQGFIVVSNQKEALQKVYVDLGVSTYVLNERRFDLAFRFQFPEADKTDWELVNSILRPTFPDGPIWLPRVPF